MRAKSSRACRRMSAYRPPISAKSSLLLAAEARARVFETEILGEHAEGAHQRGHPRHDHHRNGELPGDGGRVYAARAAAGHQGEIAHVVALLGADLGDEVGHHGVDGREHRLRGLVRRPCSACCPTRATASCERVDVELDVAAEEIIGGDVAEHQVRVGHRGLLALAVGGGTGVGARALRADPQQAERVDRARASRRRRRRSARRPS